jgi:hypothetical protein
LLESQADTAPNDPRYDTIASSKVQRLRPKTLSHVSRRTRLGRRIAEMTAIYLSALGGEAALSPMKRLKVDEAAQLKALAEKARGDYMRDGVGSLDDVVRIERKASAAERALAIVERQPRAQSLAEYLASKAAQKAASEAAR